MIPRRAPALALVLCACATALPPPSQPGAADVYRAELAKGPKGKRAGEVRDGLEAAELESAKRQHTVLAYRTFLSEFPDGPLSREARALLEGVRWVAADKAGTEAALQGFLADEPAGAHAAEAWARLAQARLRGAIERQDAAALRSWLQQNPAAPGREQAAAALEELELREAVAAPLGARGGRLQAWLRDYPGSAQRAEALALLERAALDEALVLEDEPQLRALRRGPAGEQGVGLVAAAAVERAAAQLDAGQLRALADEGGPAAERARGLAAALAALKPGPRAELVAAAGALFLPAPVAAALPEGVPARARALRVAALALDGSRLAAILAETGAAHPYTALAAIEATRLLLHGLPREELRLRVERLRAQLEPLAQDGPRLAQLALLAGGAGDERAARDRARAAVARDPRSLVAVLVAAGLEAGAGPQDAGRAPGAARGDADTGALAPAAIEALTAHVRALVEQHDPALLPAPAPGAPGGPAEPALWTLCAAQSAAVTAAALAAGLQPGTPGATGPAAPAVAARRSAEAALANAARALAEAERAARKTGACGAEQGFLAAQQALRAEQRRQAADRLLQAGPLGAAAVARAKARDPDPEVQRGLGGPGR